MGNTKGQIYNLSRRQTIFKLLVPCFALWGFSPAFSPITGALPLPHFEKMKSSNSISKQNCWYSASMTPKFRGLLKPQFIPRLAFCSLPGPSACPSPVKTHTDQYCSFHTDQNCTDPISHPRHPNHKIVPFMHTYSPGLKA